MSYFATAAFKPQIRQEGFQLGQNNPPSPSHGFDPTSMFMLPDPFRKFPALGGEPAHAHSSMDFSEELASLMANPAPPASHHQPSSSHHAPHERASSGYDDGYRPTTHNIFDISAPTSHHHHSQPASASYTNSAFSLPTTSRTHELGLVSPPNSLHSAGPLHEFSARAHFNSTVPALNSSMRFDPHPPPHHSHHAHEQQQQQPPSSAPPYTLPATDFSAVRQQHTPSPVMAGPSSGAQQAPHNAHVTSVSRSRSRSRAPSAGPTRTTSTTRAKRNSISSTSPPPRPTSIMIPGAASRPIGAVGANSPLSLHAAGGWFIPGGAGAGGAGSAHPEFSLPTPDSISSHNHFALNGARDSSLGPGGLGHGLGVSPHEAAGAGKTSESPPASGAGMSDAAAKQAAIASEKRRRRRESHNAVERRRRDNINEKIGELATLIPECMLDPNAPSSFVPPDDAMSLPGTGTSPEGAKKEDGDAPTPAGNESTTPTNGSGAAATASAAAQAQAAANAQALAGDGAAAKANKGMILRKSVDYIRYLQQLVSAQAGRNRELEDELAGYRSGRPATSADGSGQVGGSGGPDEMGGMMLHDEDVGAFMGMAALGADGGVGVGAWHFPSAAGLNGLGMLASVREDMDVEADGDDGDRPGTAMTGMSSLALTSPSAGSGTPPSFDDEHEHGEDGADGEMEEGSGSGGSEGGEEEERGRRGRDGRVGGFGRAGYPHAHPNGFAQAQMHGRMGMGEVRVKKEGE